MKKGKDYIGVGVGGVIINSDNKILLLKRKKSPEAGCWTIPGGTVEFGERIEDTIIREILEELGVQSEIICLLGVTNHIVEEENVHWVSPSFLVKITDGIPQNIEKKAHESIEWFDIDDLPNNLTITTSVALSRYKEWHNINCAK